MKEWTWNLLYRRWRSQPTEARPGYTMLLTVPPDLPVFVKIAVENCARQDDTHLVETLVVPDHVHRPFRGVFESMRAEWPQGRLRRVELRPVDRLVRTVVNNPRFKSFAATIHWLQLVNGVEAVSSTHALIHDADLFMTDDGFLRNHFEACRDGGLSCLGMDPPWSGFDWAAKAGFEHVVASWELMFDLEWMRGFRPWQMRPQGADVHGRKGWFGTTLLAQALTPPERVRRHEGGFQHVHFAYVISGYRHFQRSEGPWEDERFSLLLVRLLVDAYDPGDWPYDLPSLAEFVRGLTESSGRVYYTEKNTAANYPPFREKLESLFESGAIGEDRVEVIRREIEPFDTAFAWSSPRASEVV